MQEMTLKIRLEFDVKARKINLSIGKSFEEIEDELVEEELSDKSVLERSI